MTRFLVAPDSFKGTFAAATVATAIAAGIEAAGGAAELCPVADGGEGTLAVLLDALGGELRSAPAHDPLRRPIEASFGLLADGETATVEVAQASGLPLLAPQERDPERADTYGTGELIEVLCDVRTAYEDAARVFAPRFHRSERQPVWTRSGQRGESCRVSSLRPRGGTG